MMKRKTAYKTPTTNQITASSRAVPTQHFVWAGRDLPKNQLINISRIPWTACELSCPISPYGHLPPIKRTARELSLQRTHFTIPFFLYLSNQNTFTIHF